MVQCGVFIVILAVFHPNVLESIEARTMKETPHSRITRGVKTSQSSNRAGLPVISPTPCPDNADFCENAEDYPTDLIKDMLSKQPKALLNQLNVVIEVENEPVDKFGPGEPDSLCPSEATVVYPKKVKGDTGLYEFVVNDDEHKQGIFVEKCGYNNQGAGECNIPGSLAVGYSSRCVQKHIVRTLVVLKNSSSVEGFVTKPVKFPSCCSCVITLTSDRSAFSFVHGSNKNPVSPAPVPIKGGRPSNARR